MASAVSQASYLPKPTASKSSRDLFTHLPPELLLEISDHLQSSQSDLTSFAHTSQHLYGYLEGYRYKDNIKRHGSSALIWAIENKKETVVRKLLRLGADVNCRKANHAHTPLTMAVKCEWEEMVELLLSQEDIDVNFHRRLLVDAPLILAVRKGNMSIVRRLMAVPGIDVNITSDESMTPFLLAASFGNLEMMSTLLKTGRVDINAVNSKGECALWLAVGLRYGNVPLVRYLLAFPEVNVNIADQHLFTPLLWATRSNQEEVVKLLLTRKTIEVHARDMFGFSAWGWAIGRGYENIAKALDMASRKALGIHGSLVDTQCCQS